MATSPMTKVVAHLRKTALLQEYARSTDEYLLEAFLAHRDEAAFEALVRRYGSMVLGICRRVLRRRHDAEDAFQATFLVLIRKAGSIRKRELLVNWLYGVAYRTALHARRSAVRREAKERRVSDMASKQVAQDDAIQELLPYLDQELSQLPDKYRVPIILCDLEGKARRAAAQQLNLPERTLSTRLARARVMLAKRLSHHGMPFSCTSAMLATSKSLIPSSVPHPLLSSTVQMATPVLAATAISTGAISSKVAVLTEGVLRVMLLTKLKKLTLVFLVLSMITCFGEPLLRRTTVALAGHDTNATTVATDVNDTKDGGQAKNKATTTIDPLDLALTASLKAKEVRSAKGTGTFEVLVQERQDKEPKLRTKATFQMFYDRGKYLLRFDYQTKLIWTTRQDELGKVSEPRLLEWKPKEYVVLYDGTDVYGITYREGAKPSGSMVEVYSRMPVPGTHWILRDPARLGLQVTNVEKLIENLGRRAITMKQLPKGGYLGKYFLKESPSHAEFEIRPEVGFNITAGRVYNPDNPRPITTYALSWKKMKGNWYADRLVREFDRRGMAKDGTLERAIVQYSEYMPNASVDPSVFQFESLHIPADARTFDRRPPE